MLVLSANSASTPADAELREAVHVEVLAVERRLIDLEVAGVNHDAARRVDRQRHAVGHAVRDAEELDRERPIVTRSRGLHRTQPIASASTPCSSSFGSTSASVSARAVDRAVEVRQHVRHRADVILVPVRQHERRDPVLLQLPQIRE